MDSFRQEEGKFVGVHRHFSLSWMLLDLKKKVTSEMFVFQETLKI